MKGVKGKPPVMLFVAVAVALFAIVQLGSYVKAHGGIIPKPNVSQSQEKEVKNEKRPSFFGSPSPSPSPPLLVLLLLPLFLVPHPPTPILPLTLTLLFPLLLLLVPSSPSASPPVRGSVGGYGYIVIEVARPSDRPPASSEDVLKPSLKVVEIP
jgi:hypothetical protein